MSERLRFHPTQIPAGGGLPSASVDRAGVFESPILLGEMGDVPWTAEGPLFTIPRKLGYQNRRREIGNDLNDAKCEVERCENGKRRIVIFARSQ